MGGKWNEVCVLKHEATWDDKAVRIGGRNVSESSQMNKPSHQRSSHSLGEVTPVPIKSSQNVLTGFENMEYCKVITEYYRMARK